ncbi:hypothetical protein [Porphyromonas levii]|uniref:hypothetical protein n=1 Tax=Porphyromonas levii TaxID=28114 RepID=UPI001B8D42A6|nr:hypothetical protein [Porphyromonas levii]
MSKEYYKKRLVDLRASIAREREAKKRDNARYAQKIKSASSPSLKTNYRKSKISASAAHDRRIESLKREVERTRDYIKRS